MKYTDNRHLIKTGDLIGFSGGGWSNWHDIQVSLVRMFTQSEYSHVAVAWVVANRVLLLEAVGTGVRIYPLSNDLPCYLISRNKTLSEFALEWALSIMGQEYSKWQAIKAFFGAIKIGHDKSWECAEYVLTIYNKDLDNLSCLATPTEVIKAASRKWNTPVYYLE